MLTLSPDELREITGSYARPADQLRVLLDRGFYRAAMIRGHLVLERSHSDAVTRAQAGEVAGTRRPMRKSERQKAATA